MHYLEQAAAGAPAQDQAALQQQLVQQQHQGRRR